MKPPLLIILGPTASGKTQLAVQVTHQLDGEIISADSRQVYKGMDIGTGKDLNEYVVNGDPVPYHLIDIRQPGEQYNVSEYQEDFGKAFGKIIKAGKVPVVCGGTGFYIYSILKGHAYAGIPVNEALRQELETETHETLIARFEATHSPYHELADTSTRKRTIRALEIAAFLHANPGQESLFANQQPAYDAIIFGLNPPVEMRRERISKRLNDRLASGMIEEVKGLLDNGITPEQLIYYGLEYKLITQYLTGEVSYNWMKTRLESEIHRFAKRQMTFFRKMEKDGLHIHWLADSWTLEEKAGFIIENYSDVADSREV